MRQEIGPTMTAAAPLPSSAAQWDPFPALGDAARTTADYGSLGALSAPLPAGAPLYPAFRPFAALDGDPTTAWLPDPYLPPGKRWMEVAFKQPRNLFSINVTPKPVEGIAPLWVGISVNGGPERQVLLRPGANKVPINSVGVRTLRFRVSRATGVELFLGAGGIAEIRIPGVHATEALRLPSVL